MTQHRHTIPKGANQTASVTDPDLTPYAKAADLSALALRVAALEKVPTPMPPPVIVPAPFPLGLQAAINSAASGAVIDLTGGPTYREFITIGKNLTLIGAVLNGTGLTGGNDMGILVHAVSGATIKACTVTDYVYAGIMAESLTNSLIQGNTIQRIGMATAQGGNAYGIAITALSGEPLSADVLVDGNTVEDVPIWHGIDTHGGQRITFTGNVVRRCSRGLFLTNADGRAATDLVITNNQILAPSPATYNLVPITLYAVAGATFTGNKVTGWGSASPTSVQPWYDYGGQSTGLVNGGGNVVTP